MSTDVQRLLRSHNSGLFNPQRQPLRRTSFLWSRKYPSMLAVSPKPTLNVRSDSARPYPETLRPLSAGGESLQPGIFSFVSQVHSADDRGQRLKANKLPGLSVRRRRQPDCGHGVLGSEK